MALTKKKKTAALAEFRSLLRCIETAKKSEMTTHIMNAEYVYEQFSRSVFSYLTIAEAAELLYLLLYSAGGLSMPVRYRKDLETGFLERISAGVENDRLFDFVEFSKFLDLK